MRKITSCSRIALSVAYIITMEISDFDVSFVTTEMIICMSLSISYLFTVRSIVSFLRRASRYCLSGIPLIYAHGLLTLTSLHKWISNAEVVIKTL